MFRFIHTADVHIDSPLLGLVRYEGAPVEAMRNATREAFDNLVQMAIDEKVEFVVIAGDLFDGSWKDINTGLFLVSRLTRLGEAQIPVFIIRGNHDAESVITKALPFPDNVRVFSARNAETFEVPGCAVVLHGRSFGRPDVAENLVPSYPPSRKGIFNIGVLHTALEGHSRHATYAPCTVSELINKGYNYWALGHVHDFGVIHEHPHVVFPGNLQGRHVRERGAKGCVIVTVDDGQVVDLEHRVVDVARWHIVEVDVSACMSLEDIRQGILDALNDTSRNVDGRVLAARVRLTGKTSFHGSLLRHEMSFAEDVRAMAATIGGQRAWIEKVVIETSPTLDETALRQRQDALAMLDQAFEEAVSDEVFFAALKNDLDQLRTRTPLEVFEEGEGGLLDALRREDIEGIVSAARSFLTASLSEPE